MESRSRSLVSSYIRDQAVIPGDEVSAVLFQLCEEVREKNKIEITQLTQTLNINQDNVEENFCQIANEVCGAINWGRVISLFVFGREIVKQQPEVTEHIIKVMTYFLENCVRDWISAHGGWEGLIPFSKNVSTQHFCVIL